MFLIVNRKIPLSLWILILYTLLTPKECKSTQIGSLGRRYPLV